MRVLIVLILWVSQISFGTGSVIVLHGTSSAGKSSIALQLKQLLPGEWSIVAIDDFLGPVLVEKATACGFLVEGMSELACKKVIADHIPELLASFDETIWNRIKFDTYTFVKQQAYAERNVILDTVLEKNEFDASAGFMTILHDVPLFLSLVYCSPFYLVQHTDTRNCCGDFTQARDLSRVLQMFCDLYVLTDVQEDAIDTLTELDFIDQRIVELFRNDSHGMIIPAYGMYDCIVNTGIASSKKCAEIISLQFLLKNKRS